jgi:hypothetical protein
MIFTPFNSTDIVSGRTQPVSTGIWSDGETSWSTFYTSSRQAQTTASQYEPLNGLYYLNVYDAPSTGSSSDVYFAISYGHVAGSGSSTFDQDTSQGSLLYPTKAIYNQYRNLLLSPGDQKFSFAVSSTTSNVTSVDSDDIYVIHFRTTKYKDRLDPGQYEITLQGASGSFTFIDDSKDNPTTTTETGGKRYNLIRGTLASGAVMSRNYQGIGSMYPDLGIIVLNPSAIQSIIGSVNGRRLDDPVNGWNGQFADMKGLMFDATRRGSQINSMKARVTEYVPARHFFVRVKNQEYNYSNNPSFVITANDNPSNSQDIGKLRFADFSTDPKVYITTIGLYNDNNDLVAVAKLSQPVLKDFSNESLIKIRLDW